MKKLLTIAGSDSSGGAGIQADLKTFAAHKTYGMSAITALTAQNTCGVTGVLESSADFLAKQLDAIFTDIFPDAVKIGMVSNGELIKMINEKLKFYQAKNIVVDPVMVATSGSLLIDNKALENLKKYLLSIAQVITPNIPEAEVLSEITIKNKEDMEEAAKIIAKDLDAAILIKGGHLKDSADDLVYYKGEFTWLESERVDNPNTHGTGCTLSSAIAANLAQGKTIIESIELAKAYVKGAIEDGLDLGQCSGPLNHLYKIKTS